MGKGKKRPWIQAKIAAAEEGGGGKEAAVLAEAERRKKRKAADRAARERAFKEQNPGRFVDEGEDDEGGFGGRDGNAGDGDDGADATADDGWSGPDPDGNAASRMTSSGADAPEAFPNLQNPPGGYAKPPRDRPPPPPWRDDERTDVATVPDVEKWMRSKEARLPEAAKEARRSRAEAITRQIAAAAQHKQLGKAVNHFRRLVKHERLIPTSYTYATLLNAYVNSGDVRGAEEILRRMNAVPGMAPNVVVYTTMLKGHMLSGDVRKAEALVYHEMPSRKPPVEMDARAVNTFLRVCQRAGDAPRAWAAYRKIKASRDAGAATAGWASVVPDDATYKLVARLLSQSLSLGDLRAVIADAAARAARDKAARVAGGGDASAAPCQFWNAGGCDRGAACAFFHDPEKTQRADVEAADAVAAMHVNLAHCAALLDEAEAARLAIERANDALDEAEALALKLGEPGAGGDGGGAEETRAPNVDVKAATLAGALADSSATATYKRTTRAELRLELKRVGGFLKRVRKGAQEKPDVAEYLTRALVFENRRVEGPSGGGGIGKTDDAETDVDALVTALHVRLCDAFGLERACAVSARVTAAAAKARLRGALGDDGRVDFAALFSRDAETRPVPHGAHEPGAFVTKAEKTEKKAKKKDKKDKKNKENTRSSDEERIPPETSLGSRPVKLEICAGNGDWAVAQALADPRSDWVALELRHDRVYSIFSRAVCEGAPNLCAMGGDAASVLRKRVRPESVSHVFVNFPEPPHHSGDANAVNEFHLLTPDFFRRTHAALVTGGGLTLFSDNHRYMRDLARTLAELTYDPEAGDDPARAGEPLFAAEAAKPRAEERDARGEGAAADADEKNGGASFENIEGVRLYRGVPGEGTGHLVHEQSYFDRFWEQGARTERFFAVVSKN